MALTLPTPEQVRAVIKTALTDAELAGIIDDAALLAEGCPVVATYSAGRQAAILKWIAAHMLASTNAGQGALTQQALGDASESYARPQLGDGLKGTTYGQQAIALDPSGSLANLGKRSAFLKVI